MKGEGACQRIEETRPLARFVGRQTPLIAHEHLMAIEAATLALTTPFLAFVMSGRASNFVTSPLAWPRGASGAASWPALPPKSPRRRVG